MKVKIKEFKLSERKCYIGKMLRYIGKIGRLTEKPIYYNPLDNFSIVRVEFDDGSTHWFEGRDLEEVKENDKMKMRIKYFEGATKLEKIAKGNWIDVYSSEDIFVKENDRAMIPLGFALELPKGWEGHMVPRSSTFKTWGLIQTNHQAVIDDSYIGDNDMWRMPVYCLQPKDEGGTWVRRGDKVAQIRIMEVMPDFELEEVEYFGNEDRGAFGTTGKTKLNE